MVPFTHARPAAFPLLIASTLALLLAMNIIGAPLATAEAPAGIISFELAGSLAASARIISSWNGQARLMAAFSLGLDYLFMFVYAAAIGLGCVKAGGSLRRHGWPLAAWGQRLGWGAWLAALLDAIENAALAKILLGAVVAWPWPQIAAFCAAVKFGLIFIALVYIFYALAAAFAARISP